MKNYQHPRRNHISVAFRFNGKCEPSDAYLSPSSFISNTPGKQHARTYGALHHRQTAKFRGIPILLYTFIHILILCAAGRNAAVW